MARPRAPDVALGVILALVLELEVWAPALVPGVSAIEGSRTTAAALLPLAGLALALRRSAPLACVAIVSGALLAADLAGPTPDGLAELAAMLVAVYSVAAHRSRGHALAGLVVALAATGIASGSLDDAGFAALLVTAAWLAGRALRTARQRSAELEALTAQLEAEREERARLAVALERSRLARELHDVVAHAVSVMIVQAGGVRGMLRLDQREEREALDALEATGRQAMGELRRTLGLLRDGAGPALAPPPRLEHLDGLVDGVRRTGLRVRLRVDGTPRPLAPGIELSAFRVVQEALTNAVRHAEAESADVLLRYGERALEIDVSDDGRGVVASNGSAGHGLAGMRERVAVLGGELEAGPGHDGGFRVHALLPVRDARA